MGFYDLEILYAIKNECQKLGVSFVVDSDTQEGQTRIMIDERGYYQRVQTMTKQEANDFKKKGYRMFVPDLINFELKLIIEYQEEPKPYRGAKIIKKGHDEFSDLDKDLFYELGGFSQCKLWENNTPEENTKLLVNFLKNYSL